MLLTAAERTLLHLHAFWNAREPGREVTQAGIAEGARILRSHVPRTLRTLADGGLVEAEEAHLRGRARKARVYRLTEAGVRRARELLSAVDAHPVDVDGRRTTIGEARAAMRLAPLAAVLSLDANGRLGPSPLHAPADDLVDREEDLGFLRRWLAGPARVAVVYGSRGMGKTSLGRAFARTVPRAAWLDIVPEEDFPSFAATVGRMASVAPPPATPSAAADALLGAFDAGTRLLVVDGYGDVREGTVEALELAVRRSRERPAKVLVLAQETTPAYCRFYARADVESGLVAERHLRGLDLEGCRKVLGNPGIEPEALRRIFLLTKGCPLYLALIRAGDERGLRAHSRFTTAEIRLLLYSGGALRAASPAS